MNKKLLSFLLVAVLVCSLMGTAFAVSEGSVTFTTDGKLAEANFEVNQVYEGLEPGDTRSYTVTIHNRNNSTTRWYMSNAILNSLEETDRMVKINGISGGAYTYRLVYVGPKGSQTVIYDSAQRANDYVGGSNSNSSVPIGLHEATSNLENYFFLDTLNSGENGSITLTVSLEGETQDNNYQNTNANIKMNFAVELSNNNPNNSRTAVKTGDENRNLLPYYVAMVITGLLFLYFALDAYTDRKYQKGRARK